MLFYRPIGENGRRLCLSYSKGICGRAAFGGILLYCIVCRGDDVGEVGVDARACLVQCGIRERACMGVSRDQQDYKKVDKPNSHWDSVLCIDMTMQGK